MSKNRPSIHTARQK